MTIKINIISGFLGAGKTTFLKKIIPNIEGKITLIENEFGDVGVDGDLLDGKFPIKEIYAGCICCSVAQDFKRAIEELALVYRPDYMLIEPSGVGSLSDIIKICQQIAKTSDLNIEINQLITIVDASAFDDYYENFGTFYSDQIKNANMIFLSHLDNIEEKEIKQIVSKIRAINQTSFIFNEEWYTHDGEKIIEIFDTIKSCEIDMNQKFKLTPANKVFSTLSVINPRIFIDKELDKMIISLKNESYGFILRAKGILKLQSNKFVYFDYTPHHNHWEYIEEHKEPKLVVIGSNLNKEEILKQFQE